MRAVPNCVEVSADNALEGSTWCSWSWALAVQRATMVARQQDARLGATIAAVDADRLNLPLLRLRGLGRTSGLPHPRVGAAPLALDADDRA